MTSPAAAFNLPTDTRDTRRCLAAVAAMPITDVNRAHPALAALLTAMMHNPPPPAGYLEVLEMARSSLAFLQEEVAARYASKPLPPAENEDEPFRTVVGLWQTMARSYSLVAERGGGDPAVEQKLPLICHRCITYAGLAIVEHYRAHRTVAKGLWLDVHGYYDTADEWGLAGTVVAEPLATVGRSSTCSQAYAAILLSDLANPYGRSPREFAWILRWARRFAPMTAVARPDANEGGRGYGVDLMQDEGLKPVEFMSETPSARLFDTTALGTEVQKVLAQLKQETPPMQLGLGEECTAAQAHRLLLMLYRPWCLAAMPRRYERKAAKGQLPATYGFEKAHYFITGQEFQQPQHVRMFSRAEMDSLWTFRNQLDPTQPLQVRAAQLGFILDNWDICDQSLNGYRLRRGSAGSRVMHGELLAIKPAASDHFQLAFITWLILEEKNRLHAGIQVFAGRPTGTAVRPTGVNISPSERYAMAFLLPPVPALKEPASLLIPRNWYQPERVIEMFTDRAVFVRLVDLLAQGADFERCSFVPAD